MVGKNILRGNTSVCGEEYTKYNKIKNNLENFRGIMTPLSCGPGRMDESFLELCECFLKGNT